MTLIGITTPRLLKNTKIGLEFKGGYEILYTASPQTGGKEITKAQLTETANLLSERANGLGVAEPDVIIEGNNLIRVKLAGVSSNDQVRKIMEGGGALPLKLTEKYSQTVGGVLGEEDLQKTLKAGAIALGIILAFMVIIYRWAGLVAVIALITYLWMLLVVFNLIHATLSLAAIIAFVLGTGIASDANILAYERIKEELKAGKAQLAAIKDGERLSWRTILDSNLTGLICALVLFIAGIGPIRGFALTTILSIAVSLICNVFLSRFLLNLLARTKNSKKGNLFAVKPSDVSRPLTGFNFVKYRYWFLSLSTIIAIAGAVALMTTPLNLDIEFKAGTALDVAINKSIAQEDATVIMEDAGVPPATVAIGGDGENQIAARFDNVLNSTEVNKIIDAFKAKYGPSVAYQENTADPAVAQELVKKAIWAIGLAILGVFAFVTWRLDWRFALATVIGVLNSAFFVLSIFSIFHKEIDVTFIAAILTVIGYAVNDTIVVFDRIRENLQHSPIETSQDLANLVNGSIWQILKRSIFTVLTVITGAISIYYLGAEPLQMFSFAILIGLLCGAYSSIFIAANIWFWLKRKTLPANHYLTSMNG